MSADRTKPPVVHRLSRAVLFLALVAVAGWSAWLAVRGGWAAGTVHAGVTVTEFVWRTALTALGVVGSR